MIGPLSTNAASELVMLFQQMGGPAGMSMEQLFCGFWILSAKCAVTQVAGVPAEGHLGVEHVIKGFSRGSACDLPTAGVPF